MFSGMHIVCDLSQIAIPSQLAVDYKCVHILISYHLLHAYRKLLHY